MNSLSKGTMALLLVGLTLAMLSGAALAQTGVQNWDKTNPVEYYGANQIAMEQQNIVQGHSPNVTYDNQIPQELVGMQELAAYESIVRGGPSVPNTVDFETAMWAYDNGIPQELFGLQQVVAYESKLHGQSAELSGTLAQGGVLNWDKTNPVEYYGAYQIAMEQLNVAQDQTDERLDSIALEGDTPCGQC